jgi:hypothetical protein
MVHRSENEESIDSGSETAKRNKGDKENKTQKI